MMRTLPLDSDGKYFLQLFLKILPKFPCIIKLHAQFVQIAKKERGKVSEGQRYAKYAKNKLRRVFIDIYKRICIKISKQKGVSVNYPRETEEKIGNIIKRYQDLETKDVMIRLCYQYLGDKDKGFVTQQQTRQFYEEVNRKAFSTGKASQDDYLGFKDHEAGLRDTNIINFKYDEMFQWKQEVFVGKLEDDWKTIQKNQLTKLEHKQEPDDQHQNKNKPQNTQKQKKPQEQPTIKIEESINTQQSKQQKRKAKILQKQKWIQRQKDFTFVISIPVNTLQQLWDQQVKAKLAKLYLQNTNIEVVASKLSEFYDFQPSCTVLNVLQKLVIMAQEGFQIFREQAKEFLLQAEQKDMEDYLPIHMIQLYKSPKGKPIRDKFIQLVIGKKLTQNQARQTFLNLSDEIAKIRRKGIKQNYNSSGFGDMPSYSQTNEQNIKKSQLQKQKDINIQIKNKFPNARHYYTLQNNIKKQKSVKTQPAAKEVEHVSRKPQKMQQQKVKESHEDKVKKQDRHSQKKKKKKKKE